MGFVASWVTQSNNIVSSAYSSLFVDYANFDFHLKSTSAAVDAGSSTNAPAIDLDSNLRVAPYDVGCYEYIGAAKLMAGSSLPDKTKETSLEVFPNPVQQTMIIRHAPAAAGTTVSVISSDSRELLTINVAEGSVRTDCNLQKIPSGHYVIVLRHQGKAQSIQIIKL